MWQLTLKNIEVSNQIKREKDIYHQGPRPKPIICHLPDPPTFLLPTTFKLSTEDLFTSSVLNVHALQSIQIM
jgi:hypothetical protein